MKKNLIFTKKTQFLHETEDFASSLRYFGEKIATQDSNLTNNYSLALFFFHLTSFFL